MGRKIPTNESRVGEGLFQAFSGLSAENLPEGPELASAPEAKIKPGRVVLRKETAHRGGKTVLVIDGFDEKHSEETIAALAKKLRNFCGCGGAVKARTIELQGNNPTRVRELLQQEGFTVAGIK